MNSKQSAVGSQQNAWQDMGLARLAKLQAAGECGDYAELQSFYDFMEGADPIIKAVIHRRRDALCALSRV